MPPKIEIFNPISELKRQNQARKDRREEYLEIVKMMPKGWNFVVTEYFYKLDIKIVDENQTIKPFTFAQVNAIKKRYIIAENIICVVSGDNPDQIQILYKETNEVIATGTRLDQEVDEDEIGISWN